MVSWWNGSLHEIDSNPNPNANPQTDHKLQQPVLESGFLFTRRMAYCMRPLWRFPSRSAQAWRVKSVPFHLLICVIISVYDDVKNFISTQVTSYMHKRQVYFRQTTLACNETVPAAFPSKQCSLPTATKAAWTVAGLGTTAPMWIINFVRKSQLLSSLTCGRKHGQSIFDLIAPKSHEKKIKRIGARKKYIKAHGAAGQTMSNFNPWMPAWSWSYTR